MTQSKLVVAGAGLGIILGVLVVPVTLGVLLLPFAFLRGGWPEIVALQTLADPRHPYFRAGVVAGLVVGISMAVVINRIPPAGQKPAAGD